MSDSEHEIEIASRKKKLTKVMIISIYQPQETEFNNIQIQQIIEENKHVKKLP